MTTFKCLTKLSFTNLNTNNYDITTISQLYLIFFKLKTGIGISFR